jgi:hypothetical protein
MKKSKRIKRNTAFSLILTAMLMIGLSYWFVQWWMISIVPFKLITTKGGGFLRIILPVRIKGRDVPLFLDTGRGQTEIKDSVWNQLARGEVIQLSMDRSFLTELSLPGFHREIYIHTTSMDLEQTEQLGVVGTDIFHPAQEVGPDGPSAGCRMTLNFRSSLLTIDTRPWRSVYRPAEGSIVFKLTPEEPNHSKNYVYTVLLSVNGLPPLPFGVDTGSPGDLTVPIAMMQKLSGKKDVKEFEQTPLRVNVRYGEVHWQSDADPWDRRRTMGLLGLKFLMKYHVVLDYRDMMLYLEPPQ